MLNWFLNVIFYIVGLWGKSYDELINTHRTYERRILISTLFAAIFLLIAFSVLPDFAVEPSEGIEYASYLFKRYIGLGVFVGSVLSLVICIWNIVGLINFRSKNGITQ